MKGFISWSMSVRLCKIDSRSSRYWWCWTLEAYCGSWRNNCANRGCWPDCGSSGPWRWYSSPCIWKHWIPGAKEAALSSAEYFNEVNDSALLYFRIFLRKCFASSVSSESKALRTSGGALNLLIATSPFLQQLSNRGAVLELELLLSSIQCCASHDGHRTFILPRPNGLQYSCWSIKASGKLAWLMAWFAFGLVEFSTGGWVWYGASLCRCRSHAILPCDFISPTSLNMIFLRKSSIGLPNIHDMSFSFHPTYSDQSAPCPSLSYIHYIFASPFFLHIVL